MEFCDSCQNKLNIKWRNSDDEDKFKILIYYCTTCGNIKEFSKNTIINPKLYFQSYEIDKSYITFNNELLCSDPTLQKINNSDIKCPTCIDLPQEKQDIIYYIYDNSNMKYLYICCHCKSSWKIQ